MPKNQVAPEIQEAVYNMYRNIRHLRQKEGLSIRQMAEIAGVSERALCDAENCAKLECLYNVHIKNICVYFKVSADALAYEKFY